MVEIALALLAVLASAAAVALLRARSRRLALVLRAHALPPGARQLAATVSELSDPGFRLPAAERGFAHRRRSGALLGPR
jgi:hypothetical protein